MGRQLHFNLFLHDTGHHEASCDYPSRTRTPTCPWPPTSTWPG
jgi:hypothetical protein